MIHKTDWTNDVSIVDGANLNRIENNIKTLDVNLTETENNLNSNVSEIKDNLRVTWVRVASQPGIAVGSTFNLGLTKEQADNKEFICNISNGTTSTVPITSIVRGRYYTTVSGKFIRLMGTYGSRTGIAFQHCDIEHVSGTTWKLTHCVTTYSYNNNDGIVGKLFTIGYRL